MSDTKPYTVEFFGIPHTVLLDDDEAEKRGLKKKPATKAVTPDNKSAAPANKGV